MLKFIKKDDPTRKVIMTEDDNGKVKILEDATDMEDKDEEKDKQ